MFDALWSLYAKCPRDEVLFEVSQRSRNSDDKLWNCDCAYEGNFGKEYRGVRKIQ